MYHNFRKFEKQIFGNFGKLASWESKIFSEGKTVLCSHKHVHIIVQNAHAAMHMQQCACETQHHMHSCSKSHVSNNSHACFKAEVTHELADRWHSPF